MQSRELEQRLITLEDSIVDSRREQGKLRSELQTLSFQHYKILRETRIKKANQSIFTRLKNLNLPIGSYAVMGDGVLGIRNLKKVSIITIIISPSLQKSLASAHPIIDRDGWLRYISLDKDINAYWEGSAYALQNASSAPKKVTAPSIIASAEIIEGVAFQSLKAALESARRNNASSDVAWINEWMHDEWLKEQSKEEESFALQ